ncbi:MAG: DsbA family oxidoreductase [Rhodobiaceae bacterium]|jgi:predicted DsbA family dithiol-disulfide isomerase|nr:DsbA family oxidoreductase [Rhodobiaceae bacterium]
MEKTGTPRMLLEIVSDTICPWCYIGKQKLDAALAMIGDEIEFDVRWRPFELNPDMPSGGLERRTYRSAKFGSWEKSQALDAQVHAAGADVDLDFRHDRMAMTPNTLSSHVLVRLAWESGLQDVVIDAIFMAYFTEGRDVGHDQTLTEIGVSCGMDGERIKEGLVDEDLRHDVKSEAVAYSEAGVNSVPSVLLNRHLLFSGAQSPERIDGTLRRAAANGDVVSPGAAGLVDG